MPLPKTPIYNPLDLQKRCLQMIAQDKTLSNQVLQGTCGIPLQHYAEQSFPFSRFKVSAIHYLDKRLADIPKNTIYSVHAQENKERFEELAQPLFDNVFGHHPAIDFDNLEKILILDSEKAAVLVFQHLFILTIERYLDFTLRTLPKNDVLMRGQTSSFYPTVDAIYQYANKELQNAVNDTAHLLSKDEGIIAHPTQKAQK